MSNLSASKVMSFIAAAAVGPPAASAGTGETSAATSAPCSAGAVFVSPVIGRSSTACVAVVCDDEVMAGACDSLQPPLANRHKPKRPANPKRYAAGQAGERSLKESFISS